ncbi:hypothetical protein GGR57DRAFT_492858 [Xylariaceae sp. FL1272]|nr:hypothetical protein GGR57DRAFT_492858 [Xylariaceae sp. FL1272]
MTFMVASRPRQRLYVTEPVQQQRNPFLRPISMDSPLLDEIDIHLDTKRMDVPLLNHDPPVIYRQAPSTKVDEAWQDLVDSRPVPVTREKVLAMGKDPKQAVQIPPSWGYGDEVYFGRVDVFHQIHCLDALRREAHFEHYYGRKYPGGFNETDEMHRLHLSHCLHLLLQNIMCTANTDVYTHIWTDTVPWAFPDFNINHRCRDFSAIQEWQEKHAIDEDAFLDVKRPEGYPFRVMSHRFKEVHNWPFFGPDDHDDGTGEIA